jgi:magnesium transporter
MNSFITTATIEDEKIVLEDVKIQVMNFNPSGFKEIVVEDFEDCLIPLNSKGVTWINVEGLENQRVIKKIAHHFGFHELLLEDVLHKDLRPKIDFFDNHILILLQMLKYNTEKREMESEQVSLVMGHNYVISFQEEAESDVFGGIRNKIRAGGNKLVRSDSDFLLYSLIDSIVDHYFIILEHIGDDIENLEEKVIENAQSEHLQKIYEMKRDVIFTRRSVYPLREILAILEREEVHQITKETRRYLRDVYDHTIQIMDAVESMRDVISGLVDLYMSGVSNRMNTVMKTLTIISTIFMPLTFVAGIYGMNFDNMPELHYHYGYFWVLGGMAIILVIMVFFFRKKGWL